MRPCPRYATWSIEKDFTADARAPLARVSKSTAEPETDPTGA